MRLTWLFAFALVACARPAVEIEDVLAAHKGSDRYIEPAKTLDVRRWEVGQWALYKLKMGDRLGYVKHAIVSDARCGFWFETVVVLSDYEDRNAFKVCLHEEPDLRADLSEQRGLLGAYIWRRGNRTVARDLTDRRNDKTKTQVLHTLEGFPIFARRSPTEEGRSEIVVAAGQFAGVRVQPARMWIDDVAHGVTLWFHADVPLGGVVKAVAVDDDDQPVLETELLDYGLTDAKSELPDFNEYAKTVGLD